MAIKIQGTTIIDDSKNIRTESGFYSDSVNSAIRPKSSSGASYLQRWTGSTWDTIFVTSDTGITCNRSVSVANGYYYYGDGSQLSNLPAPVFPYNYYYDSNNTAVRAAGTTYIQNSNGSSTWAAFVSGANYFYQYTSISGELNVTGRSNSATHYSDSSNTALRAPGGIYMQNSTGSSTHAYFDSVSFQVWRQPYFYDVNSTGSTADPNLKLGSGGGLKYIGSTRRIKENIRYTDLEHICEKIYDLRTVYFNYKENDATKIELGLIAEDVDTLTSELVWYSYFDDQYEEVVDEETGKVEKILKEGAIKTPMSVAYDKIPLVMIGTFKKLRQRVIDLEEQLETLKQSLGTP